MTCNLSLHIEHHPLPDLPSNRYQEIAPKIEELFDRYGLTYTADPIYRQLASAWRKSSCCRYRTTYSDPPTGRGRVRNLHRQCGSGVVPRAQDSYLPDESQ